MAGDGYFIVRSEYWRRPMKNNLTDGKANVFSVLIRQLARRFSRLKTLLAAGSDILVVCYVLLALYSLPLIVILTTFVISDGFTKSSSTIEFSMALAGLYASDVRETLGTFVVPFIMAYAVAGAQKNDRIEARTLWLFFSLAILFVVSIVVYCAVTTRIDLMLSQTSANKEFVIESKRQFLSMSASYVKELLVYISLLIGISRARRSEEPQ